MRARTRPGRLAVIDRWLTLHEPQLITAGTAVIDFGFGETPVTTHEWAHAISAKVIGVERDLALIEAARRTHPTLQLVHGGFEALASLAPATVVRAMNVLRGYPATAIASAHQALAAPLIDGGVLLEGSCDTEGHVTVAHVLRKRGPQLLREALVFHTTFERGFSPWLFRDWLPRDLRRSATPGTPIFDFLAAWHAVFETTRGPIETRFAESVTRTPELTLWETGGARWAPAAGVPLGEA